MHDHYIFDDEVFEVQFENCDLSPKLFSHEAHIRLAWIHIKKYGIEKAIINIDQQLSSFVDSLGLRAKYNKTVTIAAVKAVYHFILKSKSDNFKSFIEEFPRLKVDFIALLKSHYSIDLFNSENAKTTFIDPDILPFD